MLLAVVAFPWSCATGPTPMTAQGEDGVCENDGDCQIVDYDCTKKSDWIAVCSRHVCQRRSVSFFSPKPSCE